jgi:peptidoglycan/LPS O-acetylase OafA/YrhL
MPQLDTLRAFAVAAVLVHHFFGGHLPAIVNSIPWGFAGVRLFFVLSGFLITGILLRSRTAIEVSGGSSVTVMSHFYARRFLRIFPLYYLVVGVTAAMHVDPVRAMIASLLTYTFNIQVSIQGWFPANISHFWSLAVEEQFYVVWPWFVMLLPRRWLLCSTLAMIAIGPSFRAYAVFTNLNSVATYCLTFSALDALGMGALLAVTTDPNHGVQRFHRFFKAYALVSGLGASVLLWVLLQMKMNVRGYIIFFDAATALCFSGLVYRASTGFRGWVHAIFECKPFLYCGKIAYGIYVYHLFMPLLLASIFGRFNMKYPEQGVLNFFLATGATFIVASVSWYLFERPLNNLKRHFSYKAASKPSVTFEYKASIGRSATS